MLLAFCLTCCRTLCLEPCRQEIKLWALVPPRDLLARIKRLEKALAVYTPGHLDRCDPCLLAVPRHTWPDS